MTTSPGPASSRPTRLVAWMYSAVAFGWPETIVVLAGLSSLAFRGVLGHLHVQSEKIDPGPAFQWERVLREARKILHHRHEFWDGQGTSLGHMRRDR